MNPLHYPSLELTKKLPKEICNSGFGYAEWQSYNGDSEYCKTEFTSKESFYDLQQRKSEGGKWVHLSWIFIECPYVMELLDEMPKEIYPNGLKHSLTILSDNNGIYAGRDYLTQYGVRYDTIDGKICINIHGGNLPNALAEMWLWLKENNYLNKYIGKIKLSDDCKFYSPNN